MSIFSQMISNLQNLGVYDFFLPFILFFAILFGILQGKKMISDQVSVNGVISFAIALFITYVGRGAFYTEIFGTMGTVLAGLLIGIIFLGLFGIKPEELLGKNKKALGMLLGFLALLVFFKASGGGNFNINSTTLMTLLLILVMGGAIVFMTKK